MTVFFSGIDEPFVKEEPQELDDTDSLEANKDSAEPKVADDDDDWFFRQELEFADAHFQNVRTHIQEDKANLSSYQPFQKFTDFRIWIRFTQYTFHSKFLRLTAFLVV